MTPKPQLPDRDPTRRDLLNRYAEGDRDVADAAHPMEPTEAQWVVVRNRIRDRLNSAGSTSAPRRGRRHAALVAVGAALTAAVAWVAGGPAPVILPELVETRPAPIASDSPVDPLAGFAVLPMVSAEEVDIRRVPGSGWLPVGADPLPGALALATTDEVELDDPDSVWPLVTLSPGDAPMIFAAKPR